MDPTPASFAATNVTGYTLPSFPGGVVIMMCSTPAVYLLKRSPNQYGKYEDTVREILENIKTKKDQALFDYTKKFDGAEITGSAPAFRGIPLYFLTPS